MVVDEPPKKRGVPWFWLVAGCLVLLSFAAVYTRNDLTNAFKPKPGGPQALASHQVQVIDGDIIRVGGHDRDIRLIGFSTPETSRAHCDVERERGYARCGGCAHLSTAQTCSCRPCHAPARRIPRAPTPATTVVAAASCVQTGSTSASG